MCVLIQSFVATKGRVLNPTELPFELVEIYINVIKSHYLATIHNVCVANLARNLVDRIYLYCYKIT